VRESLKAREKQRRTCLKDSKMKLKMVCVKRLWEDRGRVPGRGENMGTPSGLGLVGQPEREYSQLIASGVKMMIMDLWGPK